LNPALYINVHVAASLLNMSYTLGASPPPAVFANPNAYLFLTDQVTYTTLTGLNRVLSFPIENTDVIQGAPHHNLQPSPYLYSSPVL